MKKILICRTDNIGDVVLTLPLAGILKQYFPDARIGFLVRDYTRAVASFSKHIDEVITLEEIQALAHAERQHRMSSYDVALLVFSNRSTARQLKQWKIPLRVGSSRRWFNWLYCNRYVNVVRRRSTLHEAQLNLQYLRFFNIPASYDLQQLPRYYGIDKSKLDLPTAIANLLDQQAFKLIVHPLSNGHTRNWPISAFAQLIHHFAGDPKMQLIVSASAKEKFLLNGMISQLPKNVLDLTGKLKLSEYIALIERCDGLLANSTGPLHIAAALGKLSLGLFVPYYTMHPRRWGPVGENAHYLMADRTCRGCESDEKCLCMQQLHLYEVIAKIEELKNSTFTIN